MNAMGDDFGVGLRGEVVAELGQLLTQLFMILDDAIVHNGIIENHEELREELTKLGYNFTSETDTEVIAHRIHFHKQKLGDLFRAVRATVAELEGAYALAVL